MHQPHCLQPANHTAKDTHFCYACAAHQKISPNYVMFCAQCNKKLLSEHRDHRGFFSIQSKPFKDGLQKLRNYVKNRTEIDQIEKQSFITLLLKEEKLDFTNYSCKKWLIETQFWKLTANTTREQAQTSIKRSILKITKANIINHGPISNHEMPPKSEPTISWGKPNDENGSQMLKIMFQGASQQKKKLQKQKQIVNTLIEAYSSFQPNKRLQKVRDIDEAIEKFPNQCLLLMMKLYLSELHEGTASEWQPILNKILELKPQLKGSPFNIFIQSHKYWIKVDKSCLKTSQTESIYMDSFNKSFFKLRSAQEYVNLLNTAIIGNQSCCILYAAKGLGLLAQKKYTQALKAFQVASQNSPHESFKMNQFYASIHKNPEDVPQVQNLLEQLQNKSKYYLINAIRCLKKFKLHEQIGQCYQALKAQKNPSTFANIQFVKALLNIGDIEEAQKVRSEMLAERLDQTVKQRLDRKKKYAEARVFAANNELNDSTSKCEILVGQKRSASACFSLASAYYNQQRWQEAEQYVNEALSIKQSDKYKKLKLHILIMKKDMNQAKALACKITQGVIDHKICQMLAQFG